MLSYLRNSVLATIAYYDILDFPLTLPEIRKYLINPARLSKLNKGVGDILLIHVGQELDSLVRSGLIGQKNGFYFMVGRDVIYDRRILRQEITSVKWKKFLKLARIFLATPYLKGLFMSGSMAISNSDLESDFDVLVIARSERLYTCRFFCWLISSLIGARRKRFDKIAPDKFCLNHYITDHSLTIPHESLYNAQTYANLKPVMVDKGLLQDFYAANIWINKFVHNFRVSEESVRRSTNPNPILVVISKSIEFCLNSRVGDKFEQLAKNYQQKRIKANPVTYDKNGRVTFNDNELEFHPNSFEKVVIEKYNQNLKRLGIIPYLEEKDSGLTR